LSPTNVQQATGFELVIPDDVPTTAPPTVEQIAMLRNRIDVDGMLRH
jgi:hypothetical protein